MFLSSHVMFLHIWVAGHSRNKDAEAPQADEPAAKRVKLEECTEQHVSSLKNVKLE